MTNVANQNQLVGWLSATKPTIVLMHFGTNDVWNNIATNTILAAYTKLVDQMRASNPSMKILVCTTPSQSDECVLTVEGRIGRKDPSHEPLGLRKLRKWCHCLE